ncbi:mannitol-1-phosphate 5-dehydrogenase [Thalassobacillus sp. CUG 92003]|uniref:mannitol-1-phosphate 5-dehydrogenase n=1 Tax=Thalassobacillus sp. CUG 92003 TaxID=2736641 RepID=UPI0015E6B576|nr:mannitol-1-phosphate 5-dehydrogenase [Thalassobacillus sp. CUG 92003]
MKAVHFGAGNIGRGFIGALLDQSGYETVFVDVNDDLIETLNQRQAYNVLLAGSGETLTVQHVSGLNSKQQQFKVIQAIAEADLVTTAVGPQILPVIAPLLLEGLKQRIEVNGGPLNIIACENMIGGSSKLKAYITEKLDDASKQSFDQQFGFPDAAVDRIVPDQTHQDPLTVEVEPFYEWVVETTDLKGPRPEVTGITFVEDLTPYIERKLFTVNTGHAAAAYLGDVHGHTTIKQAMDDDHVRGKVKGALQESGDVLIEKYGFKADDHQAYIEKIIERFLNPSLSDEITRVARAPKRKLGPQDRLIRPATEYMEWIGKQPEHLAEVIAAALVYRDANDSEAVELAESVSASGAIATLKQVAELADDHPLLPLVEQKLATIK